MNVVWILELTLPSGAPQWFYETKDCGFNLSPDPREATAFPSWDKAYTYLQEIKRINPLLDALQKMFVTEYFLC